MGVGGCGWPNYAKFSQMVRSSFVLMNSAPNSASESDDATNFRMVQRVKNAPLSVMGSPSLGVEPRKKLPDARLLGALGRKV